MSPISLPQKRFKNLLLDLDGTLIHSGNFLVHIEFIAKILPLMKGHRGWKAAWKGLSEGNDVFKVPSKEKTNKERLLDIFSKHLGLKYEDAETAVFKSMMEVFPTLKSHFGKIPGAAKFIEWAKENYTLTLATNPVWPIELVHMRMRWGGIDPSDFRSITTSDRMHACKPTRDYYEELLEQEKFKAEDCLLIGNERKMDLPATRVGIAVFLVRPDANALTCIECPTDKNPGAWRGSYNHLKEMLQSN